MKIFFDTEFWDQGNIVDLISIGLVREDGETYYAENWDFDWDAVPEDHWLQKNVRPYLTDDLKSMDQIADELIVFCEDAPTFWGYFADYDWVVMGSLYGGMIHLPDRWPMFCRDVKQFSEMARVNPFRIVKNPGNNHNALDDALWTKECFDWITARM